MDREIEKLIEGANFARYRGQPEGHYESFFLRANHPSRPLAFWIRYTIFSPRDRPGDAVGELWAIVFDGESGRHATAKEVFPIAACRFDTGDFQVRVGEAELGAGTASASVDGKRHSIGWRLGFSGDAPPVFLLPARLYAGSFPSAKSLVGLPLSRFSGEIAVGGEAISVDGWVGSQNHNWGSRHTDLYAWGQVAGFDDAPDAFLEVATARLRIGPLWSPPITPLVLRLDGREHAATALGRAVLAKGRFAFPSWSFATRTTDILIAGRIEAPPEAFVGLRYPNPPGGQKVCHNSKIASCRIAITDRRTGKVRLLSTRNRAAFEILTDETSAALLPSE